METPTHILTIDVEDWFHLLDHEETASEEQWSRFESRIERNTLKILDCLSDAKVKATFFCLGWVARKYPMVVRAISDAGHEVGSHSDVHSPVRSMSQIQFKNDLARSIKSLEDACGRKVCAYRSPGFSITNECVWAFHILAESGIETDSSVFVSNHAHGGLPSFVHRSPCIIEHGGVRLKQFPVVPGVLLGADVNFAGGGYFRLLPYSVIKFFMARSEYAVTYFHPRDFDPEQPIVPGLRPNRIFKSYVGLRSSLGKFKTLLRDFHFVSIGQADAAADWEILPRVSVGQLSASTVSNSSSFGGSRAH